MKKTSSSSRISPQHLQLVAVSPNLDHQGSIDGPVAVHRRMPAKEVGEDQLRHTVAGEPDSNRLVNNGGDG